jgi:hypothetical protein
MYRKSQVYTTEQLEAVLNTNQYCECIKVGKDDFHQLGDLEDSIYHKNPLMGNTKKYQLFWSTSDEPGVLYGKDSNSSTETHRMDLVKGSEEERKSVLQNFELEKVPVLDDCEGIRRIKQVELFSKWRKHVPDKYKSPLYDDPGEEVLQSVKEDRRSKKEYLEQQRKKKEAVNQTGLLASRKSPVRGGTTTANAKASNTTTTLAKKRKPPATKKAPAIESKRQSKSKKK